MESDSCLQMEEGGGFRELLAFETPLVLKTEQH